ncbi:ACP S-malonyltransferase [Teredinibacter sp. KSP-S5-2]|uniref:ACP S-malonyltransferase n=1 Tax=Teredinibacter sp. KSP-S5-2 TaxID=3034506 RepID=UPI002934D36E|nr:ACP S-malonyltransferase [Teredinibacter sp. KSP-S5-2]WNO10924.1 ACP S-malonyltransferase [Teredinibacter sp. KSP-S5-2]
MNTQQSLAFVFPGQGSQKVGMLEDFYGEELVKNTFAQASDVLGYDLLALIQEGPQEKLNMTEVTQPALLTCSVALWRLWQSRGGVVPAYMAGHSLGEWSALVCAEVVKFEDAVALVRARGQYMQEAVPAGQGAMAAIIGLGDEEIEQACEKAAEGQVVCPVNYNSPGQVVIAGESDAVERAMALCKEAGAKRALPLPVSAPFHTSLMKPAADRLAAQIQETEFSQPKVPVVHNVSALPEANPEKIKAIMVEQIYSAVQWVDCVKYLVDNGVETTIECGPGKVLAGLVKRIHKPLQALATESEDLFSASLQGNH